MIIQADCLDWLVKQPTDSVDLSFCSPPYEDCRLYDELGFRLSGRAWVAWMAERIVEMVRVTNGLVAVVVEGRTRKFRWSATPALLMADLDSKGIHLRKPPIFHRVGIPGSGGPDWLRNDYEFIVCCSKPGRLPWSDNKAAGKAPKWNPGGAMSNRMPNGRRVAKLHTKNDGRGMRVQGYNPPKIANPGNVIRCDVGGGRMGSKLAHENEAPFPEKLAEFFVKSFSKPGGIVLDCFAGSFTTCAVAHKLNRQWIGIDKRMSQCEIGVRRLAEAGLVVPPVVQYNNE